MMKVGDLVIVNVPIGGKATSSHQRILFSTQGIIISMKKIPKFPGRPEYQKWWYVLRNDTGTIGKFHTNWMEEFRDE